MARIPSTSSTRARMLFHRMASRRSRKARIVTKMGLPEKITATTLAWPLTRGQLVEHHGQGHAEEPGDGEGPQVLGGEFPLLPVQGPGGHRQQEETADQETAQGDLHGMEGPSTAGSLRITSMVEKIKVASPMQTQPNKKFCFSRIPLPPVARPKIVHGSL